MRRTWTLAIFAISACTGSVGIGNSTSSSSETGDTGDTGDGDGDGETGSTDTGSTDTGMPKLDVGDDEPPNDECKVVDDNDGVAMCTDQAPPDSFDPVVQWEWWGEGGYSESYVPFCGLATIETLAGVSTGVVDPFAERFAVLPGQPLQPHQAEAIDAAAAALALLR